MFCWQECIEKKDIQLDKAVRLEPSQGLACSNDKNAPSSNENIIQIPKLQCWMINYPSNYIYEMIL